MLEALLIFFGTITVVVVALYFTLCALAYPADCEGERDEEGKS